MSSADSAAGSSVTLENSALGDDLTGSAGTESSVSTPKRFTFFRDLAGLPQSAALDPVSRELQAESITVRIRWFGLAIGFFYVNMVYRVTGRPELNAMLTLGMLYAMLDTLASLRGRILLSHYRIGISMMEALFIGLLCFFDQGVGSPFRFYYFLSLLVCAIRHSPSLTFSSYALHSISYIVLGMYATPNTPDEGVTVILTLVFLGWTAWAITALTGLLKSADKRLFKLNRELQKNQQQLEARIAARSRELQESQAMLVQQEKQAAFGLLASGIAHEVGNPLASISSIIQLLSRKNEDPYFGERLQMVDGQLTRIQKILRELSGFSRPTSRQSTSVDVHTAIQESLNIAKYYKRWKGKHVHSQLQEGLPTTRAVYDQLVQVLLNLILNALDATEEGARITIATSRPYKDGVPQPWISITVADEGCGIAPEAQKQIFQPYFTTKSTGTGLGLFVCRQLAVQTLQGDIRLVKSDASGTTFELLLPIIESPDADSSVIEMTPKYAT
ncbi:MAG: two-component sensor histidine kinase [Planctomycetaceae bacterium]|nr:two-component sensor histidine kinase [Planctomycetaceae bacterium]